jgi:hypothetical protein
MSIFFRFRLIPEIYLTLLAIGSVLFFVFFTQSTFEFNRFTFDLFGMFSSGQVWAVVLLAVSYFAWLLYKKSRDEVVLNAVYVLFFVTCTGIAVFLLHWVFQVSDIVSIVQSTIQLTEWDRELFGVYLYFLPTKAWLEFLFIGAYWLINFLVGTFVLLALFCNKILLRKFIFCFLLISILAAPVWYFFPATSPAGFFRQDVFHIQPPSDIVKAMEHKPLTPYMQSEMTRMRNVWIVPVGGYFNVSTIPSLHAGYGLLLVLFFYGLRKYSLALTLPWFALNCVGAVYIEQHFGLDILVGVLFAVGVYFFTGWLFRYCGVK